MYNHHDTLKMFNPMAIASRPKADVAISPDVIAQSAVAISFHVIPKHDMSSQSEIASSLRSSQ